MNVEAKCIKIWKNVYAIQDEILLGIIRKNIDSKILETSIFRYAVKCLQTLAFAFLIPLYNLKSAHLIVCHIFMFNHTNNSR